MNSLGILGRLELDRSFLEQLRSSLSPLLFWSAIVLPLFYIPLLALGVDTIARGAAFATLLVFHVVALWVGHSYTPQ